MSNSTNHRAAIDAFNTVSVRTKLLPFRIHFEDPEIAPLDLDARDANDARELAAKRRGVPAGAIRKVKIIREQANG